MSRGRGVLFVAHGAEVGGPTRLLLAQLRWLREHRDVPFEVALLRGGELEPELRELAPVWILEEIDGAPVEHVDGWRARRRLRREWRRLDGFDLTVVSTTWTGRALRYLPTPRRLLVHVHELDAGITALPRSDRTALFASADVVVAGCAAVEAALTARHGVAANRIVQVPYPLVEQPRGFPAGGVARRRALGIPDGTPVVGTVAVTDLRKAPDLLLEVAWHLRHAAGSPAHLVWVGGPTPDGGDARPTAERLERLGLGGRVHFVGPQRALWDWYRAFDLFALPSREDAFPLAVLEAAAVGVPTVCFDTGGIVDFVRDDAGAVVAYPHVERFATTVADLLADDDRRAAAGAVAAARVASEHDHDRCLGALADVLEGLVRP